MWERVTKAKTTSVRVGNMCVRSLRPREGKLQKVSEKSRVSAVTRTGKKTLRSQQVRRLHVMLV